jgi:hypothetical protein
MTHNPRAPAFSRSVRFVQAMLQVMASLPWMCALLLGGGYRCGGQEVVAQESPAEGIERHRAELRVLDEDAFLAAVHAMPALADSDPLVGAGRVLGQRVPSGRRGRCHRERGWVTAVVPVFECVARGLGRDHAVGSSWFRVGRWGRCACRAVGAVGQPSRAGTRQCRCGSCGPCGSGAASDHSSTRLTMATNRFVSRPDARWRCSPRWIPTPPLWWLVRRSCAEALLPRQVVASVPAWREFQSAYGTLRGERQGGPMSRLRSCRAPTY